MAGLTLQQLEFLAAKGLSLDEAIEFAKLGERRSAGAVRQARYRARKKGCDVTDDVTRDGESDASPTLDKEIPPTPPKEINPNPPPIVPPKPKSGTPAKPEDVSEQVWLDFLAHRKAKKAPLTETALAGVRREVALAGWTLEAALVETITRGWQSFKADFVNGDKRSTGPPGPSGYFDHFLAQQQRAGANP